MGNLMHKIALVEDDPTMLSLLQTLLQMEGFQVVQITPDKLDDFLEIIRSEKPDLTLMDVHLRQVSGLDLLKLLRQDPELKNNHVILSSGLDVRSQCQEAGADNFILKPYMPDDLIKIIRQAFES
jgi:CheY-like chemotaxis protein